VSTPRARQATFFLHPWHDVTKASSFVCCVSDDDGVRAGGVEVSDNEGVSAGAGGVEDAARYKQPTDPQMNLKDLFLLIRCICTRKDVTDVWCALYCMPQIHCKDVMLDDHDMWPSPSSSSPCRTPGRTFQRRRKEDCDRRQSATVLI
jgi:hypothetical protein